MPFLWQVKRKNFKNAVLKVAQHYAIPLYTLDEKMKETAKLRGGHACDDLF